MYIEHFEDIPKDALKAIKDEWDQYGEIDSVEGIIEAIHEGYEDCEETTDSCYITKTYSTTIGDWRLEVEGNSYRKDQSICDQEMDDGFSLISLEAERKEKAKAKNAKRAKSDENWRQLFSSVDGSITPEKAFDMFKDYKFPKKW